jgi:hypothetical protein
MNNASAPSMIVQKCGSAALPSAWPSDGIVQIVNRAGNRAVGKAIQSSAAGNVYVHGIDDTDASGVKTYTLITLEATTEGNFSGVKEVPFAIDEIRESGTTIALGALTVWI